MIEPSRPRPAPLNAAEKDRIWRWERSMIRSYAMAMMVIAAGAGLAVFYGEIPAVRRVVLLGVLVLVVAVTLVQFRERCPRCGSRLGRQTRLMLPDACKVCGVQFPRPPKLDSELDN